MVGMMSRLDRPSHLSPFSVGVRKLPRGQTSVLAAGRSAGHLFRATHAPPPPAPPGVQSWPPPALYFRRPEPASSLSPSLPGPQLSALSRAADRPRRGRRSAVESTADVTAARPV